MHGAAAPRATWTAPPARRPARGSWFLGFLVAVQLCLLVVPWNIFETPEEAAAQGVDLSANPLSRALKLLILALATVTVFKKLRDTRLTLKHTNRFFVALVVLMPLSALWSIDRSATIARFVTVFTLVQVCMAFAIAGPDPQRFQNVVRPVFTLLLAGSLIFGLVAPDLAITKGEGTLRNAWHGLTGQKNQFGQLASIGTIFWLHAWVSREAGAARALAGAAICGVCVFLSHSSTSLLATVFVFFFMLLTLRAPPSLRRFMPYLAGVYTALILTYAIAILKLLPGLDVLLTPITALTGKDMTFSNRSEIWIIIKENIQRHPYLGSGYGAYWTGPVPTSPSYEFLGRMYFYPFEAHNGYLEIVNDFGYLGLVCLLGFLIVYVRQSLRLVKLDRPQGILLLCLFFQQAIMNLSESTWFQANAGFTFMLLALATLCLARSLREAQQRRTSRARA
jgi:exopolysaccharide production protein ExoQ